METETEMEREREREREGSRMGIDFKRRNKRVVREYGSQEESE